MDKETRALMNSVKLGEIAGLSNDAKMLIILNPEIINKLAEAIADELDRAILEGNKNAND